MFFWLLLVIPFVRGDIDFMDCGSKSIIIDKIDIPGCDYAPCRIYKGNSYHLYITPELIDPEVKSIRTYASVVMWGAHIPIHAHCDSPCITDNFPFIKRRQDRNPLNITVDFPLVLLDRPAEFYLWAEYKSRGKMQKSFCVAFEIDITSGFI